MKTKSTKMHAEITGQTKAVGYPRQSRKRTKEEEEELLHESGGWAGQ